MVNENLVEISFKACKSTEDLREVYEAFKSTLESEDDKVKLDACYNRHWDRIQTEKPLLRSLELIQVRRNQIEENRNRFMENIKTEIESLFEETEGLFDPEIDLTDGFDFTLYISVKPEQISVETGRTKSSKGSNGSTHYAVGFKFFDENDERVSVKTVAARLIEDYGGEPISAVAMLAAVGGFSPADLRAGKITAEEIDDFISPFTCTLVER